MPYNGHFTFCRGMGGLIIAAASFRHWHEKRHRCKTPDLPKAQADGGAFKSLHNGGYPSTLIVRMMHSASTLKSKILSRLQVHCYGNSVVYLSLNPSLLAVVLANKPVGDWDTSPKGIPPHTILYTGTRGERTYVIGTQTERKASTDDVISLIRKTKPDIVALALSKEAQEAMENPGPKGKKNEVKIVRTHEMEESFSDMIVAAGEAKRIGAKLVLCGRNESVTYQRSVNAITLNEVMKGVEFFTAVTDAQMEEFEDLGQSLQNDVLTFSAITKGVGKLSEFMLKMSPSFYRIFIIEREMFLAKQFHMLSHPVVSDKGAIQQPVRYHFMEEFRPPVVVCVVDIIQLPGIKSHWDKVMEKDLAHLNQTPEV